MLVILRYAPFGYARMCRGNNHILLSNYISDSNTRDNRLLEDPGPQRNVTSDLDCLSKRVLKLNFVKVSSRKKNYSSSFSHH